MKLTNKILLVTFGVGLIFASYVMIKIGSFVQIKTFETSGIIEKKAYEVDEFDEIRIGKGVSVFLSQGETESLLIEVDTSFRKYLRLDVNNRKLNIKSDVALPDSLRLIAYLSVNSLDEIEVSGMAKLSSSNIFRGDSLTIKTNKGGKLVMDLDLNYLKCRVKSGSKVDLSGSARSINAIAKEGAKLKATNLKAVDVKAEAEAGAQMYFSISGTLDVKASSGARVKYAGDPVVTGMEVSSGGRVTKY